MTDVHSCSYYCDRPECIKAQRDELRDRLGSMTDRELMQQVFDAMSYGNAAERQTARLALRERLAQPNDFNPDWDAMAVMVEEQQRMAKRIAELEAQPEQEPNYWLGYGLQAHTEKPFEGATALYTAPPQRKPLTDERIGQIVEDCKITLVNYCSDEKQTEFARAIEAAHGIKGES